AEHGQKPKPADAAESLGAIRVGRAGPALARRFDARGEQPLPPKRFDPFERFGGFDGAADRLARRVIGLVRELHAAFLSPVSPIASSLCVTRNTSSRLLWASSAIETPSSRGDRHPWRRSSLRS